MAIIMASGQVTIIFIIVAMIVISIALIMEVIELATIAVITVFAGEHMMEVLDLVEQMVIGLLILQ